MTEPTAGDRVWAKGWGDDVAVFGILQPATMDEPRVVRDDFGNDHYVAGTIHRYDVVEQAAHVDPFGRSIGPCPNTPPCEHPNPLHDAVGNPGTTKPVCQEDNCDCGWPKRINVAVNLETIKVLRRTIERDGISLTEAVRRLIGVGDVVSHAVKAEGASVVIETEDETREVVIL